MLYFLPALVGVVSVIALTSAYWVARSLTNSRIMQAGAARMPEGAAHDIA